MADEQKTEKAGKGRRERAAKAAQESAAQAAPQAPAEPEPKLPARLRLKYEREILPALMRDLKITNKMRAPRLDKIVINMALGEARENVKILDAAADELQQIAGQKPVVTRARKAISNFKLREGMPIGVMVTLRRDRKGVRRARQLFARPARAYDFPRAQSRQDRKGQRDDRVDRDHGGERLRRTDAAARARDAVSGRERRARRRAAGGSGIGTNHDGQDVSASQSDPRAKIQGAPLQSLSAVRTGARLFPAVQDVPVVPAQERPQRRAAGRGQGELVGRGTERDVAD
jgi:hypothetical protein